MLVRTLNTCRLEMGVKRKLARSIIIIHPMNRMMVNSWLAGLFTEALLGTLCIKCGRVLLDLFVGDFLHIFIILLEVLVKIFSF